MENNDPTIDPEEARAALADIDGAEHAVRDVPWPAWLYLANAFVLLVLPATQVLPGRWPAVAILIILAQVYVNRWAGERYSIPWAVPSDVAFRICCFSALALSCGGFLVASFTEPTWYTTFAGVVAAPLYLLGCVRHHRKATR